MEGSNDSLSLPVVLSLSSFSSLRVASSNNLWGNLGLPLHISTTNYPERDQTYFRNDNVGINTCILGLTSCFSFMNSHNPSHSSLFASPLFPLAWHISLHPISSGGVSDRFLFLTPGGIGSLLSDPLLHPLASAAVRNSQSC